MPPKKQAAAVSSASSVVSKNIFDILDEGNDGNETKATSKKKGNKDVPAVPKEEPPKIEKSKMDNKEPKQSKKGGKQAQQKEQKKPATKTEEPKKAQKITEAPKETSSSKPAKKEKAKQSSKKKEETGIVEWVQNKIYFVIFICLAGFLLSKAVGVYERRSITPMGDFVKVADYNVNYWCTGPKNSPNVLVFIPDYGRSYLQSYSLLKALSAHTRVCGLDRAGRGFSDDIGRKYQIENVTSEIQAFFSKSGETGPFVLVGDSYGALISTIYTLQHPKDVKGLVLLNPIGTSFYENGGNIIVDAVKPYLIAAEVATITGVVRIAAALDLLKPFGWNFESDIGSSLRYAVSQQRAHTAALSELTELQPKFVELLKNTTQDGTKLTQSLLVINSESYDTDLLSSSVNDAWTKITQKDTTFSTISPKVKVSQVKGGRFFNGQEIATQIQTFVKSL